MRAVVPIYDTTGQYMIGYTARSTNQQCGICGTYHYFKYPCPRNKVEERFACKWRHSDGFYSGSTLYNIWNFNGDTALLVEGTGDVWSAVEAGCNNCLGLFGCNISKQQIQMLVEHGIQNVILCLDNDDAGKTGTEKIISKIKMYFNIDVLSHNKKDIGELTKNETKDILGAARWKLLE